MKNIINNLCNYTDDFKIIDEQFISKSINQIISKYQDLERVVVLENTLDSYLNYMIQFDKEYQTSAVFYKLNPAERLANIKSSKIVCHITNKVINKRSNLLKDIFYYNYLKQCLYRRGI